MTTAKILFEENLKGILNVLGIQNFKTNSFIIVPTIEEENHTNWDDIFKVWSTPTFKGIRLSYIEVINALVKETQNTIPIWVKVSYKQGLPIVLEISQRFRKVKNVVSRNPENNYAPFEIDNNKEIEQILSGERKEAIRILLFKRIADIRIKDIIGDEIRSKEIKQILVNHLKKYRFYPPDPKLQKPGDENYSGLVINQDYKTGKFSICNAENLDEEIRSNLDLLKAINYYVENEMKKEFCGIKIKH